MAPDEGLGPTKNQGGEDSSTAEEAPQQQEESSIAASKASIADATETAREKQPAVVSVPGPKKQLTAASSAVGPSFKVGQRAAETHEGGLKRSFANLGSSDVGEAQGSPRRAFILPADSTASALQADSQAAAAQSPTGHLTPFQESMALQHSADLLSNGTGDVPTIAGLRIGPSNARKRDVPSTEWATSLPHKLRLQDLEDGRARFSPSYPEESDRLRLMQMQLTDRQSSHAHASSSASPWASRGSQPVVSIAHPGKPSFEKASSPDIPEPPHKKGSGQGGLLEGPQTETQLRRKQADSNGSPLQSDAVPQASPVGSPAGPPRNGSSPLPPGPPLPASAAKAAKPDSTANGFRHIAATQNNGYLNGHRGSDALAELGTDASCLAESPRDAGAEQSSQLKLARLLGTRGRPEAALKIADQLVLQHPDDADVLCLRGTCFDALGNRAQAFACFSAALHADPMHLDTLLACGNLHRSCLLLPEATEMFRRAYEVQPRRTTTQQTLAAALTDLGTKLKMAGQVEEGMYHYKEALSVWPTYGPALYNIGVVWSEAKDYDKALEFYDKAVEAQPAHAEAHCNMGVIHKNQGRLEEAVAAYERALAAAPNFQIVCSNLAIALTEKATLVKADGDFEKSIELYERALTCNPRYTEAMYNLAVAHGESGQLQKAAFMYEMAVLVSPECAEAHNNLGVIYRELSNMEKALQCYLAALHIRPNFPQALNNVAVVYTAQGKAQDAHHMLMAAIAACPTYSEAYNNLGVLHRDVGAVNEAIAAYDKCLELQPGSRNAGQNRLLALNYVHPGELPMVCAEHEEWGIEFQAQFEPLPPLSPEGQDLHRRLTVGYLSPDFFTHSVSYFAEAPLTHHNPERVKVIAYNCTVNADGKTRRLQKATEATGGAWKDVAQLSEAALAALVREDGVDILVELTGHTANNRLGVMAKQPAPVQATWIGYPNSTGLAAVDYRFTDMVCDPLDTSQTFVEELVRLPGCFLCYTPAGDAPPLTPLPAADLGFVTFGSFNALAKITPEVVRLWARLLLAAPGSRLLLKNKPAACEHARRHFLGQMEAEGVAPERVDLLPLTAGNADHLATYAHMDISLDPFPYAGTTTTCESLFMGVPVVSLAGGCHAHNVGASLLTSLGLSDEWLAHSQEEYVDLALAAAQDLPRLARLRAGLRERMLAAPLCDGPGFVEALEGEYRRLWQRWLGCAERK